MSVNGASQTIMSEKGFLDGARGEVHCLHHTPGRDHTQHRVEERVLKKTHLFSYVVEGHNFKIYDNK